MDINRINYEQFALDYLEGNLPANQLKAMESFLQKHPDIKEELAQMNLFYLEPETKLVFENKASLKKGATTSGFILWSRWGLLIGSLLTSIVLVICLMFFQNTSKDALNHTNTTSTTNEPTPINLKSTSSNTNDQIPTEKHTIKATSSINTAPNDSKNQVKATTPKQEKVSLPKKAKTQQTLQKDTQDSKQEKQKEADEPNDNIPMASNTNPHSKPIASTTTDTYSEPTTIVIPKIASLEIQAFEPVAISFQIDESALQNITIVVEETPEPTDNKLEDIGLIPSSFKKRFKLGSLKEALIPEAYVEGK